MRGVVLLWAVGGCVQERSFVAPAPAHPQAQTLPLDDVRLLRRLSMDLRGTLPTLDEVEAVEADGAMLAPLTQEMLDDPRLEGRLISLFGEWYRTRLDKFALLPEDYGYASDEACAFDRSVGEEPLRLAARIAVEDRPWSDVVTTDQTMANEILEDIWPVERESEDPGWQLAHYTDGRPAAGMLATNGLWWRYETSAANANRSRGAALSDLFLCQDLLARPVSFRSIPVLEDDASSAEVIRAADACLACHSSLDPLSAALMGFYPVIEHNTEEAGSYHPAREALAMDVLGTTPAYFGVPMTGMVELGPHVGSDPRFFACAAEMSARLLWRRDVGVEDRAEVELVRQGLIAGELRFKAALAATVALPTYRAGEPGPAMDEARAETEPFRRLASPTQLASAIEELTGFVWATDGCQQLDNDDLGFRTLAGGLDGLVVTAPQSEPSLSWLLVRTRLAEGAALHAVQTQLVDAEGGRLFDGLSLDDQPGEPAFEDGLGAVHRRVFALAPSPEEQAIWTELWSEVADQDGAQAAWVAVLTAMLRDPAFLVL